MKKILFLCSTAMLFATWEHNAYAQIAQGGFPLSMKQELPLNNAAIHRFVNPDWQEYLKGEKERTAEQLFSEPLKVGLHVAADINFPEGGQMLTLSDGSVVWRSTIVIDGAPAIGFLFDRFQLPKGVKLFLTNENKRQVAGAFDASNNPASGRFAIDAVQGGKVLIELNIDSGVDLKDIEMHIDNMLVFQRSIEHLARFVVPIDNIDPQLNGLSSVCNINAICPQGVDYANSRKATIQTIDMSPGGGACSGTLVNNTANTATNCTPYIVTASHCQGSGSLSNTSFDQMLVRFNFERPDCSGLAATDGRSMTGVDVLSRANYHESWEVEDIIGDFMVYQLRQPIPASYGAVLAGWNRNSSMTTTVAAPKKFIGFHHPYGDNKKLTTSQNIQSHAWPSGTQSASGTKWFQFVREGYLGPGSSGSGLFDGDGRLIGIASVASLTGNAEDSCFFNSAGDDVYPMDMVWYDKLSHGWEYNVDGTDDNRRVKPWLDPANTGAATIDPVTSACVPLRTTSVNVLRGSLNDAVSVFPNPSADGKVLLQYNLKRSADLIISVLDVTGRVVYTGQVKDALNGAKELDLSHMSDGIYMVKVSSEIGQAGKKIVISK